MVQDIKPNNILLNFDPSGTRVVEAKLADCGKLKQQSFHFTGLKLTGILQVMHATSVSITSPAMHHMQSELLFSEAQKLCWV